MKNRLLVLIFPIFLTTMCVRSQDLVSLYAHQFPPEYRRPPMAETFLRPNLERLATLKPDLVYYLAEVVTRFAFTHDSASFREGIRFVGALRNRALHERAIWAKREIEFIQNLHMEGTLEQRAVDFFAPFLPDIAATIADRPCPFRVDTNRLSAFRVIFLTENAALRYDSTVDFGAQARAIEGGILEPYRRALAGGPDVQATTAMIDDMPKYWYLFLSESDSGMFQVGDLVARSMIRTYSFGRAFNHFTISLGYATSGIMRLSAPVDLAPLELPVRLERSFSQHQVSLSLEYRMQFKPIKTHLSYVSLRAVFQGGGSAENRMESINRFRSYQVENISYRRTTFNDSTSSPATILSLSRVMTLMLEASVPVYYAGRDCSIMAGVSAGLNTIDYAMEYTYHFRRSGLASYADGHSEYYLLTDGDTHRISNEKAIQWFVRPMVGVELEIFRPLTLWVEATYDFSRAGMGVSF